MKKTVVRRPPTSERERILQTAMDLTTGQRNFTYGDPQKNLSCHGELSEVFSRYLEAAPRDYPMSPGERAAVELVLCKLSRIACGVYKDDNYIDGAAYFGIAGECARAAKAKV